MGISYYTPRCIAFKQRFANIPEITTFEDEFEEENNYFHDFDGTIYVNKIEFLEVYHLEKENTFMVFINNPDGHDEEQWVFGYYKSFKRALNKMASIVEKRSYPKPIEIW